MPSFLIGLDNNLRWIICKAFGLIAYRYADYMQAYGLLDRN